MTLDIFKKSILDSTVLKKGNYNYIVHPIMDGIPEIKPDLLNEITNEMQIRIEKCGKIDKIVTIEAMGIPLATALSSKMNIPFVIIRKKSYGLPDEDVVKQKTGYSKSNLYINGLKEGDKIVIVDDVLSTGGTLKAILSSMEKIGVENKGIFIVVDKGNISKQIKDEFDVDIDIIVNIEVIEGKVVIKNI